MQTSRRPRRPCAIMLLAAWLPVAGFAQSPAPASELPPPVKLRENDLKGLIAALPALRALDLELVGGDSSDLSRVTASLQASSKARHIIADNGFTPESFTAVMYSVGMALAALDMDKRGTNLAESRRQQAELLKQMKAQMTPEQYETMRRQIEASTRVLDRIADQPAGNIELVGRYQSQLESLME